MWGYDEITWFAHQSAEYRKQWLHYAWEWVPHTDPNGHLQMPGSRTMRSPLDGKRWYYANRVSPAVPEGLGDEETIRNIWKNDVGTRGEEPAAQSAYVPFEGEKSTWHDGFARYDFVMDGDTMAIMSYPTAPKNITPVLDFILKHQ